MGQYKAVARTNYFRVKDLEAFKKDLAFHGITTTGWGNRDDFTTILDEDSTNTPSGAIALFAPKGEPWPNLYDDPDEAAAQYAAEDGIACPIFEAMPKDAETCQHCSLPAAQHEDPIPGWEYQCTVPDIVARHLVDGDVAVFVEGGAEKMCYVQGSALAINSKGEVRRLSLDAIYDMAKELGETVTFAED